MRFWFLFLLASFSTHAFGQTSDLIGTVGRYGSETGSKGAVANRQIADQLYQQALQDEKNAWKSFPPNVGLLAKALQQSKDAKAADDQAKEFARAALHASNSGSHSGDFVNQRYGMIDESKLNELSTTSSPYASQVESRLGKYGMKMSPDKMKLETPFGTFSVNPEDSALARIATSVASKLGFSPDDVMNGLNAAKAAREGIAQKTVAALDAQLKARAGEAGRSVASIAPGAQMSADSQPVAAEADANGDAGAPVIGAGPPGTVEVSPSRSMEDVERDIFNRRRAMGLEIGLSGEVSPIGRATQDIFQMVHSRYKAIDAKGHFFPR